MGVIAVNKAGDQPLHDVETAKGFKINELVTVNAEGEFPITGGFFEVAAGTDIEYGPYKYSQIGYIIEGDVCIGNSDGSKITGEKGDVLALTRGEKQHWKTKNGARIFYTALREKAF